MHEGKLNENGRECTIYENSDYDEVCSVLGHSPPRYCFKDATPLQYYSFFDSLDRFTFKAFCPHCRDKWAISLSPEKYETKMLNRWAERVKDRDGHRCRMASPECEGQLHAHHMIPRSAEPSKQFDVENGITLCEFHHKKIHNFM